MEDRSKQVETVKQDQNNFDAKTNVMLGRVGKRLKKTFGHVTLEPVMFLDGACHWTMHVFMEVVQMNKICASKLGLSEDVCSNLTAHPEENIRVQKEFSIFVFQNSIIFSVVPLLFVLVIGAWSDLYGRKIPLIMATTGHLILSGGYLLNSWQVSWPVELIYIVTLLDALGGGAQGVVSSSVAYISDVTPIKTRTSRVGTAMSLWYFGGPLGNLIGAVALQHSDINLALGIVFLADLVNILYVIFCIKESHGPFAQIPPNEDKAPNEITLKKEDVTVKRMILDFFNWRRGLEAFKTAFKSRDGYARAILLTVIMCNMLRRAARAFFMYSFVSRALGWTATIYTYWSSYRTLVAAAGSLVLVPLLSRFGNINDPLLVVIGSLSLIGEYCCYGFISGMSTAFFVWLGPLAGLISNANIIAHKSLATKLVSRTEKGRVSAVMSATQSLMPMVGYAMYAPIYHKTVETFPEAQYFFSACLAAIILVIFLAIHLTNVAQAMQKPDPENDKSQGDTTEENDKVKLSLKSSSASESAKTSLPTPNNESSLEITPSENDKKLGNKYSSSMSNLSTKELTKETSLGDVTCSHTDKEKIGYANTMSDAEILESEHVKENPASLH